MISEAVALAGLAVASYTDLRERVVPDWLSLCLLLFGFVYHAFLSLIEWTVTPIVLSVSGAFIAFLFSYVLWRVGAWAGGDVKLFSALGAVVPTPLVFNLPLFPFVIFVNSVILSFPFVLLYVLFKTVVTPSLRVVFRDVVFRACEQGFLLGSFSVGLVFVFGFLGLPEWVALFLVFAVFFVPRWLRYCLGGVFAVLGVLVVRESLGVFFSALVVALFWQVIFYGKDRVLRRRVRVSELSEGLIPAQTLYLKNNRVFEFVPSWREMLMFSLPRRVLVSSYSAAGLEKRDIAALKRHGVKFLWVKESIPMVPVLFFGAVFGLLFGNLFLVLVECVGVLF